MQTKLTLTVDPSVVSQAKSYAKQQGVSISQMVEGYLASITSSVESGQGHPPILRSLLGTLKTADRGDYRTHLAKKYL